MRFISRALRLPVPAGAPLLLALALLAPSARAQEDPLAPVAFLVGEHRGAGKHPLMTKRGSRGM